MSHNLSFYENGQDIIEFQTPTWITFLIYFKNWNGQYGDKFKGTKASKEDIIRKYLQWVVHSVYKGVSTKEYKKIEKKYLELIADKKRFPKLKIHAF